MNARVIDINCDLGEGLGNESSLMPYISSCNIACGGHAGNAETMEAVVKLAITHGVKIGAHPSYPDKENFGRKSLNMDTLEFQESISSQLSDFTAITNANKVQMHHIKPHGALYNDLAKNEELSRYYLEAIESYRNSVVLFVPWKSIISIMAVEMGFKIWYEAFADRNYTESLQLVKRDLPNAVLSDPEAILKHLIRMVNTGEVKTESGVLKPIEANTFCIHGDNPNALEIISYLSNTLPDYNIRIGK